MSDLPEPHSPSSKFPYTTILSTLPYDFSQAWIMQPDEKVVDPDADKPPESPELTMALKARSDSSSFGALQYNLQREDYAQGYVIEDTGRIDLSDEKWIEDLIPSGSNMNRSWAATLAGNQGLTAGKIYIDSHLLAPTPSGVEVTFVSSGFCFEERFFITTRHYKPSGSIALETMLRPEHAHKIAKISIARYSPDAAGGRTLRSAFLIYENVELDIAIFKLSDSESSWPSYVHFAQLVATDQMDYSFFAGQKAFSVGYATNEDSRYSQYWQSYNSMLSNHGVRIADQSQPPNFQKIFHPCERILVLGELDMSPPCDLIIWRHFIPGWFGMSGGLIGVLDGGSMRQDKNGNVQIIGMFKGGEPNDWANQLVPFTIKLIEIISEVCLAHSEQGN